MSKNSSLSGAQIAIIGVLISFVVLIVATAITFFAMLLSYNDTAVTYEANINKYNESSMNVLSNYTLKLKEAAAVPDKLTADLQTLIRETFQGRYGEDGSQAMFQWIQENNMTLDSQVYVKLQTIIDAGRNEFKLSQDRKLEACTQYNILRGRFISGFFITLAGFPKVDLNDLCAIVIAGEVREKFETKTDDVVTF